MVTQWDAAFLSRSPAFELLQAACAPLDLRDWPDAQALTQAAARAPIPPRNAAGSAIRFVDPLAAGALVYEVSIHRNAQVQTRAKDWHDFMNALVWMTFPRAKACLNARHVAAMAQEPPGRRGPVRDALTLFDEGGAVVLSSESGILEGIRTFQWKDVFWRQRTRFVASTRVLVFGHAMHHKLLEPFVGVCAQALLLPAPAEVIDAGVAAQAAFADAAVASMLADESAFRTPRDLAPLPILGVPGWFARNSDAAFYDDVTYFRPGRSLAQRAAG